MTLETLKNGDVITSSDYIFIYQEMNLRYSITQQFNHNNKTIDCVIQKQYEHYPPSSKYPYGKYEEVINGEKIRFTIKMLNRRILLLK